MSDKPKPYIGIKRSSTPESPESVQAQEDAVRALESPPRQLRDWRYDASHFERDRSVMERWDDFMMDRPALAWSLLLGGIFTVVAGLGLIATYFGIVAFCVVTGTLIAALVFAITR